MKKLLLFSLSLLLFGLASTFSTKTVYAVPPICPSSTFAMSRQPGGTWANNNVIVAPGAPFEVAGFKNNNFSVFPHDVELVIKKPDGSRERLGIGTNPVSFTAFNYPVGSYRIELYDPNYTSPNCYIYGNFEVRAGWPTPTPSVTPTPGPSGRWACSRTSSNCVPVSQCNSGYTVPNSPCAWAAGSCGPFNLQNCIPVPTPTPTQGYYSCLWQSPNICSVTDLCQGGGSVPPGASCSFLQSPDYPWVKGCIPTTTASCLAGTGTPTPTVTPSCSACVDTSGCHVFDYCDTSRGYVCSFAINNCTGAASCLSGRSGGVCVLPSSPSVTSRVPQGTVAQVPVTNCEPRPFSNDANFGIMTGLGCIPTKLDLLVSWTLRAIAGIAGGIALLLLFYGGIMFITAGGDEKAVDEAKGIITAAISGLLLIFLSVLILKIIGVDILGLPAITVGTGGSISVPGP